jgi:hypothetical protein
MMQRIEGQGFTFWESFYEAIREIKDPETRLALYDAMCRYAFDDEESDLEGIAKMIFAVMKPNIDFSLKQRKNGRGTKSVDDENPEDEKSLTSDKKKWLASDSKSDSKKSLASNRKEENRTEENRREENRTEENRTEEESTIGTMADSVPSSEINEIVAEWNKLPETVPKIKSIGTNGDRRSLLKARIREHGTAEVIAAIREIARSDFLVGNNKNGWTINFDWFIRPNNFKKVQEGNYRRKEEEHAETETIWDQYYAGKYNPDQ